MAKTVEKLSGVGVPKLKKPGLYNDGEGLYFQITQKGSRSWALRFKLHGKPRQMGLGSFPAISLATARDLARDARGKVKQGIDPIKDRDDVAAEAKAVAANSITFEKAATEFIAERKATWSDPKAERYWTNAVGNHCGAINGIPVLGVTTELVCDVLKPLWKAKKEGGALDTGKKLRGFIEMVLDWAKAKKWRMGENPARWKGNLSNLLGAPGQIEARGHFDALPYAQIKAFIPKLRAMEGIASEAVQFTILTAARSNMVRGAKWGEIDWKNKVWTCPPDRMKGKKGSRKEHKTPLSDAALAILKTRLKAKDGPLIFPGRNGKAMSDMSMTAVIRRMKRKDVSVHGFRSTFSDWAHETTQHDNHTIEIALAHTVGNVVERAYRRGDMFAKRVAIMADWAQFCGA